MKMLSRLRGRCRRTVLLDTKRATVAGKGLIYRLVFDRRAGEYAIAIAEEGTAATVRVVGRDGERAAALFALLVKHTVTLCHFDDVLLDLLPEEEALR
ncbi:MAG: hypothetical protein IJW51_06225 [Clostridia bacterium]|nr:hypothetical protein [Clostridia bacterium]